MPLIRIPIAGLVAGQLASMSAPGFLSSVTALEHDPLIPAQAQIIDQRSFNVLHEVPPASQSNGFTVCVFELSASPIEYS